MEREGTGRLTSCLSCFCSLSSSVANAQTHRIPNFAVTEVVLVIPSFKPRTLIKVRRNRLDYGGDKYCRRKRFAILTDGYGGQEALR